jgi:methionyl aminopeptidase
MVIESDADLEGLKKAARVVALALREMRQALRPGMTTVELDGIGARFLEANGARSAPILQYNFPGVTCISINEEAAHGIPGERVIQPGDLVNIDISAELDGYYSDTASTVIVPPETPLAKRLCGCARAALKKGIAAARPGNPIHAIGQAVEDEVSHWGFTVIRNLPGHGIGKSLHEEPTILNFYAPGDTRVLEEGMVFTVEPFVSTRANRVVQAADGWTLVTADRGLAAQYEHTILVTRGAPLVLTQLYARPAWAG